MNSEPIISVRTYIVVWVSLLILTLTTTAVAFIDLGGQWNTLTAVVIAIVKTVLVVVYFMHLRYSSRLTWVFAGAGFFWLVILISLTLGDVLTRQWISLSAAANVTQ